MVELRAEGAPAETEEYPELVLTIVTAVNEARQRRVEYGVIGPSQAGDELVESVESDPTRRVETIEQSQGIDRAELAVRSLRWVHIDHNHR